MMSSIHGRENALTLSPSFSCGNEIKRKQEEMNTPTVSTAPKKFFACTSDQHLRFKVYDTAFSFYYFIFIGFYRFFFFLFFLFISFY
jgi:hypothetical protein